MTITHKINQQKKVKEGKGHRFTQASIGQKFKLQQAIEEKGEKLSSLDLLSFTNELSSCKAIELLNSNSLKYCCAKGNCFLNNFTTLDGSIDYNSAVEQFIKCRNVTRCKCKDERSKFLLDEFTKSLKTYNKIRGN